MKRTSEETPEHWRIKFPRREDPAKRERERQNEERREQRSEAPNTERRTRRERALPGRKNSPKNRGDVEL